MGPMYDMYIYLTMLMGQMSMAPSYRLERQVSVCVRVCDGIPVLFGSIGGVVSSI